MWPVRVIPQCCLRARQWPRLYITGSAIANLSNQFRRRLGADCRVLRRRSRHGVTVITGYAVVGILAGTAGDGEAAQRFFGRAILAFLSAAIGLISALLTGVSNGISVATGVPLGQALGYLGLVIATVLGMRVLVAIIRDRVI